MDENAIFAVQSVQGHTIRITAKYWLHVIESHDYMAGNIDKVLETIADPDRVILGSAGEVLALRAYASTNITPENCCGGLSGCREWFLNHGFLHIETSED